MSKPENKVFVQVSFKTVLKSLRPHELTTLSAALEEATQNWLVHNNLVDYCGEPKLSYINIQDKNGDEL